MLGKHGSCTHFFLEDLAGGVLDMELGLHTSWRSRAPITAFDVSLQGKVEGEREERHQAASWIRSFSLPYMAQNAKHGEGGGGLGDTHWSMISMGTKWGMPL